MIHWHRFLMIELIWFFGVRLMVLVSPSFGSDISAQHARPASHSDVALQDSSAIAADSTSTFRQRAAATLDSLSGPRSIPIWQMSQSVMKEYFYEDLGDILNYFPGIYVRDRGSAGQQLLATRHGANEKQTRLLFQGNPLYHPIFGGIDLNLIPTGLIDHIVVASDGGQNWHQAGSEIIKLQPVSYHEDLSYSQVGYHKAPYGFSDVDVIFASRASRKLIVILGGIIKSYDGQSDAYRFEQQNFRGKISYQLFHRWKLDYYLISNKLNRNWPNPSFASNDRNYPLISTNEKISRVDHGLKIAGQLFRASEQNFDANVFYSSDQQRWQDKNLNFDFLDLGRYAGGNIGVQHHFGRHLARAGAELIHEWAEADQVADQRQTAGSIFIQDNWQLLKSVELNLLGIYHLHEKYGNRIRGSISANYCLSSQARLAIAARQSLRYPVFFETSAKTNFIGNPALRPELFQTIELGAEWQKPGRVIFRGAAYYKYADQVIDLVPIDSLRATFVNHGTAHFWGADIHTIWLPWPKWQWSGLFTYLNGAGSSGMPKMWLITHWQYSDSFFQGDLKPSFRLEVRYLGSRNSSVVHPYVYRIDRNALKPVLLLNAQVLLNFGNLKVFFLLENILDEKYQITYGNNMNRRTLHYGLRWEFWD